MSRSAIKSQRTSLNTSTHRYLVKTYSYYFCPGLGIRDGKLYSKTVCPSAQQHFGRHYEYHNVYGTAETFVTAAALRQIRQKRALVVSRSTSPMQGHYGAHWTGDVESTWEDMRLSIPSESMKSFLFRLMQIVPHEILSTFSLQPIDIINMNMFGIPMVGADICGFNRNTTVQLCNRWMQLGAFYPFSR